LITFAYHGLTGPGRRAGGFAAAGPSKVAAKQRSQRHSVNGGQKTQPFRRWWSCTLNFTPAFTKPKQRAQRPVTKLLIDAASRSNVTSDHVDFIGAGTL